MSNTIHDISELFMYALQAHGKASFPGLGTFHVSRKPATYAENRKKILPPQTYLELDSIYEEPYNVLLFGKSIEIQSALLEQYANPLQTFLREQTENKTSELHLSDIGFLENAGGSIRFRPETEENRFNAFTGWPEIPLTPLAIEKSNIHFAIEQPQELKFAGKKSGQQPSSPFTIPVVLICLVVLFLVIRFLLQNQSSTIAHNPLQSNTLIQEKNIINETIRGVDASDPKEDSITKDSKELPAPIETSEKKPEKHEGKSITREEPVRKIDQTETVRDKTNTEAGLCTYIVGAFTKKKNAVNLRKKLQKRGYRVEIFAHDRFSRVGVWQPCHNDTSAQFQILLKEFPELWLLEE